MYYFVIMYITKMYYAFSPSYINSLKLGVTKDKIKLKLCCHILKICNFLSIKIGK